MEDSFIAYKSTYLVKWNNIMYKGEELTQWSNLGVINIDVLLHANFDWKKISCRQFLAQHLEDAFDFVLRHVNELLMCHLNDGPHIVVFCIHLRLKWVRMDDFFQPSQVWLRTFIVKACRFWRTTWWPWRGVAFFHMAHKHIHLHKTCSQCWNSMSP